jgi:hypothetical protein
VNWIRRNILHFEVEIKDINCELLSSTGQKRAEQNVVCAQLSHADFLRNLKEKIIKKGFWSRRFGVSVHWYASERL